MSVVRIGAGAGFQGDRLAPALDLAERGKLDYLVFECLGERTIALAQQARRNDPSGGYDPLLERRMRAVLPVCARNGTKLVTNMGAANPLGAAQHTARIARELGLTGLKVAAVTGDDVTDAVRARPGLVLMESGDPVDTATALDALADQFRDIEGAGDIRSDLGGARRVLERDASNRADALEEFDSALAEYEAQAGWRNAAEAAVLPGLQAFLDDTRATMGVRYAERLTREQALFLASCTANHRSLALSF